MGRVGRHEENRFVARYDESSAEEQQATHILSLSHFTSYIVFEDVIERRLKSRPAARSAGSGTRRGVQLRDLRYYDRDFGCFANSDPQVPRPDFDWDSTYLQGIQAV